MLLTFGSLLSSCAIIDQTRGKIVLSWIRVPSCTPNRKDLNSAARKLQEFSEPRQKSSRQVGEVQTNQEVTLCVKELDLLVTVQLFEDTPLSSIASTTLRGSWVSI